MKLTLKKILSLVTPPILLRGYHILLNRMKDYGFVSNKVRPNGRIQLGGDYASWLSAMADSTGYDAGAILEKTKMALLKVKNGEAVYERDSVLFEEIQYAWPILAGLMWVAARHGGMLNVLDFGGSLGSTYFQNQKFLSTMPEAHWNIVEQPDHVQIGKKWFEGDNLHFYADINDCLKNTQPNVILLCGVLQYLERPYMLLDQIKTLSIDCMIIDRTPFWTGAKDRLCVQNVPSSIYPASYPSWIFSADKFHADMNTHWKIVAEFDGFDKLAAPVKTTWKGMIATKREKTMNHG